MHPTEMQRQIQLAKKVPKYKNSWCNTINATRDEVKLLDDIKSEGGDTAEKKKTARK